MNTENENSMVSLGAATITSIVVGLSLHWTGPVYIAAAALTAFCVVLSTGMKVAGQETCFGRTLTELALAWLWLALAIYLLAASL